MYGAYHPLLVHLPLGILTAAFVFLLLGVVIPSKQKFFLASGLMVVLLGTLGLWAALQTGESAAEMIPKASLSSDVLRDLNRHYESAERTMLGFGIFAAVFTLYMWLGGRFPQILQKLFPILLLIIYAGLLVLLALTGHYGGKLVHGHGLHTPMYGQGHTH